MTERERLIKLLSTKIYPREGADPAEVFADYLIENGVIALPCKVGDSVFYISAAGYICEAKVLPSRGMFYGMVYKDNGEELMGSWFDPEDIGISVFFTREEAEKALKESEK